MIRRHLMALRLALMLGDGIIAVLVFLFVSLVRFGDGEAGEFWRRLGIDIRVAAILFGVAWVSALWSTGLYQLRIRWRLLTEARDIARTTLLVLLLTLATLFVLNQANVSRLFLVLLFLVQPVVTLAGRAIIRQGFGILRGRGYNTRYMLIAGTGTLAQDFADRVEGRLALGIRVIGHLSVPGEPDGAVSRPILGTSRRSRRSSTPEPSTRSRSACRRPPRAGRTRSPSSPPTKERSSGSRSTRCRRYRRTPARRSSRASSCAPSSTTSNASWGSS